MTERIDTRRTNGQQSGIARLPVLVVSLVLTASLALVALDRLFLPDRFAIQEVVVAGDAPKVDPLLVVNTVRALGPRSWFSVDLAEVERAVRAVPWVAHAAVRRKWPGKLVIDVAQAHPFARWNDSSWISEKGDVLPLPDDFSGIHLPRLSGPADRKRDVMQRYRELSLIFAERHFALVRSLNLNARGAWGMDIAVAGDAGRTLPVKIGRDRILERVARLESALGGELGDRMQEITAFDLRYPNGFAATIDDATRVDGDIVQSQSRSADAGAG